MCLVWLELLFDSVAKSFCGHFVENSHTLDDDAADVAQQSGFMVLSCLQTLEHLESATDKYRATVTTPSLILHNGDNVNFVNRQQFVTKIQTQWRRIMWDLRGESLTQYRRKLESHLIAIHLALSTLIWSATDRIEQDGMRQGERIEELLHQASHFNNALFHLMPNPSRTAPISPFELSRSL